MGTTVSEGGNSIKINDRGAENQKKKVKLDETKAGLQTKSADNEEGKRGECKEPKKSGSAKNSNQKNSELKKLRPSHRIRNAGESNFAGGPPKLDEHRLHRHLSPARTRDSQLKYLENNKKFVESSIQATVCVERVLNLLCHRSILATSEYNYLLAKNNKILEGKQKRYRNLELRERRIKHSSSLVGDQLDGRPSSLHPTKENNTSPLPQIIQRKNASRVSVKKW